MKNAWSKIFIWSTRGYQLFLSHFNETLIFSTRFRKILKYKILLKSVHWERSCSMRTDGRTDRGEEANNIRQQDFGTWKVYCVCNVTFHAEFKYAIRIFPSPTVFVQWHFLLSSFRNFRYFLQYFFLYVNQYFEWFWTEGGHRQFAIIKSLAACAQKH